MTDLERNLRTLSEPFVVMSIGIPGSGKSTLLRLLAENLVLERVCPDDIRNELTGSEADQSVNSQAWAEAYQRAGVALGLGRSVIIDATHCEAWRRPGEIITYRKFGAAAVAAIVFDVPLNVARERSFGRGRVVDEYWVNVMDANLRSQPPTAAEGFDVIISLDVDAASAAVSSLQRTRGV